MLLPILSIIAGLVILVWSADRFVMGAAATAKNLGMSPMLIGLTIVAFGTSAPEMLVSLTAALEGAGNLAIGNAVGSNIANIALVLGITALIAPLPVKSAVLRKEIPLLLGITLIAGYVLHDFSLDLTDGIILFTSLIICLVIFAKYQHSDSPDDHIADEAEEIPEMSTAKAVFWLIAGLLLLIASSKMLVWGATEVALLLGVSDLVIGLTIVAIGTSLPELAASITSALKNHHDIALGNVVGSNIFNLAAVMALPGFVETLSIEAVAFNRDYLVMLGLTLLLIVFCILQKPARISRAEGGVLTLGYAGYMALLYTTSI
jgi:cation:H+ antiporter